MSRFCRDGGLKVDVHQMQGNCFALYVRFNGGWNGHRRIVHTHQGGCTSECEPCCSGYDPQGAALVLLVGEWARQAGPLIEPIRISPPPVGRSGQRNHPRTREAREAETKGEAMNGIPGAILRFPDGTVVKCEGVFISPDYAAELAKAEQERGVSAPSKEEPK